MKTLIMIVIIFLIKPKPLMSLKCYDYCQYSRLKYNNNSYNIECTPTKFKLLNQTELIKINNLQIKGSNSIELLKDLFNNSKIESIKSLDLSSNEITDDLLSNINLNEIKLFK